MEWSRSAHFDVFPEAEAPGDVAHRGVRRLVGPGGAGMACAVDHHVVELDAVRALEIRLRFGRLLEPVQAHRGARKIVVAAAFDDVVALGDDAAFEGGLHGGSSAEWGPGGRPKERSMPTPQE